MWTKILKFILGIPLIFIVSLILQHCAFIEYFWFTYQERLQLQCADYTYEDTIFVLCVLYFFWFIWEIWNDLKQKGDIKNKEFQWEESPKEKTVNYWNTIFVGLLKMIWSLIFLLSWVFGVWFFLLSAFGLAWWGADELIFYVALIGWPLLSVVWVVLCVKFFVLWNNNKKLQKNWEMEVLKQENWNILQDKAVNHSPTLQKIIENIQKDEKN